MGEDFIGLGLGRGSPWLELTLGCGGWESEGLNLKAGHVPLFSHVAWGGFSHSLGLGRGFLFVCFYKHFEESFMGWDQDITHSSQLHISLGVALRDS